MNPQTKHQLELSDLQKKVDSLTELVQGYADYLRNRKNNNKGKPLDMFEEAILEQSETELKY